MEFQGTYVFGKLQCSGMVINCRHIIPLLGAFSPLATSFEAPILAGETMYPSVEHHVVAQLLRDVQKLDALRHVPMQLSRDQLYRYLRDRLIGVSMMEIENWRRNRMYNALKAATDLKFAQYPELKALLIQTGDALLLECANGKDNFQGGYDLDWGVGMQLDSMLGWMRDESVSPLALAFFTMHTGCKPGIIGSNMTGRMLMEFRNQLSEVKHDQDDLDTLSCPFCKHLGFGITNSPRSNEIVILSGPTNPLTFDYPATFTIDGVCYVNVEHFVKSKMLEEFGYKHMTDSWLTDLDSRKPSFFRKMADILWENRKSTTNMEELPDGDEQRKKPSPTLLRRWISSRSLDLYNTALVAKFAQNPHLLRALLATGDGLIVELRYGTGKGDRARLEELEYAALSPWSSAAQAGDPPAFVKLVEKWKLNASTLYNVFLASCVDSTLTATMFYPDLGKNRLGMLLMDIREKFKTGSIPATTIPTTVPSLQQFFADFLLRLIDSDTGQLHHLNMHLQRVNSFIVKAATEVNVSSISVDGRCNPLSIFYLAPFTAEGLCFPTLEHYRWWKFFEHESRYVQCVPGFWDYTDGRQLRTICEQWTNENLGLNATTVLERYRTDMEVDVLRNGALCKHSQNPHILPMLFDRVSYGHIIAGESEGDATFGIGLSVSKMRKLCERWKVSSGNLTLWWTSLKCVKPTNIGDNLYGLALMSARDEIFALYCERAAANVPMAPNVQSYNEITSEENYFINDLDSDRLFVFSGDHPTLGLVGPSVIGERQYSSVIHFLIYECFAAIGGDENDVSSILEQDKTIWQLLIDAKELACTRGWTAAFDGWFKSMAAADALKKAVEARLQADPKLSSVLLATGNVLLVTTLNFEEDSVDNDSYLKKLLTIGLTEDDLTDFLRDLHPGSTLAFQFWTRCASVSPGRLGMNLWAACLMATRKTIGPEANLNLEVIDQSCFWNLSALPEKATNSKRPLKRRYPGTRSLSSETNQTRELQYSEEIKTLEDTYEEERDICLIPISDVIIIGSNGERDETQIAATIQPMLDALRHCQPLYERVVSSTATDDQLKMLGEKLGKHMLSMFGCTPDLRIFTEEDMYNLGRIAACQINGSQ